MLRLANAILGGTPPVRPLLRIAVPSWRPPGFEDPYKTASSSTPRREDFEVVLEAVMDKSDRFHRLTRSERKQLATTRKIRKALYEAG